MSLSNIFIPQSITIVGASAKVGSVGYAITKNLIDDYQGQVFPVNPKNSKILGTCCYASILDLPVVPDLAIIVVPAKIVPIVLQQAADKGIKGVVIISAGFREVGGTGVALEDKLKKICLDNNIRLIGPNCLGVINPWIKMNASFANSFPPKGNIAFISQSGAICTAVIDYANTLGLGFSKFVSVGNKALSSEVEMLNYLEQDLETEVIVIYAEGLANAELIIETMKKITKPVVILKSGRTTAGEGASSSHTGALASADILYESLFRQAGITRANSIEELFDFMQVLGKYPKSSQKLEVKSEKSDIDSISNFGSNLISLVKGQIHQGFLAAYCQRGVSERLVQSGSPSSSYGLTADGVFKADAATNGNMEIVTTTNFLKNEKLQVAIITNAGGPGVLTTDTVIASGMEMAMISKDSLTKLELVLPPTANFQNPFDLIGDAPAKRYHDALEIVCKDQNVDAIIVILTPQTTTQIDETAHYICKAVANCKKPIVVSFIGGDKVLSGIKILRQNKVVHLEFPENAAKALSVLNQKLKVKSEKSDIDSISNFGSTVMFPMKQMVQQGFLAGYCQKDSSERLVQSGSPSSSYDLIADRVFKGETTNDANIATNYSSICKQQTQEIFNHYKAKAENYIPEVDAKKIFEMYNISTVNSVFCKSKSEVKDLISKTFTTNQKLILKIISSDIMHKSDVGGIMPNVSLENAEQEFVKMINLVQKNLPNAKLQGILFSQMVDLSHGVEFIIGAKKDPSLGTAIMFGLGGTMVELINDVVFGFGKLESKDIVQMINQLKSKKIIQGYRGKNPLDLETIITTIKGLSNLLSDFPQIIEVDMNPVLVGYNQSGVKVLDAKIVVE